MLIPPIYRFELEIDMTKTEIKEMLTKYTANSMVFGERLEEYYFFSGYIDESKFRFYPMPRKVPYYGKKNSFIPKVTGIIHSITLTKSVIKVTISGTWIYAFIFLVFNAFAFESMISGQSSGWSDCILCLVFDCYVLFYFSLVSRKIRAIFKDIFDQ